MKGDMWDDHASAGSFVLGAEEEQGSKSGAL